MQNITKTIYSICYPPTKQLLEQFLKESDFSDMYSQTWSKKQDAIHHLFFEEWAKWVAPRFQYGSDLKEFYPCAGSSEAIREQLAFLSSQHKTLVVFEGEYEGYEAIALALSMPVLKLNRQRTAEELLLDLQSLDPRKHAFFLSQPSSIDGNFWALFDVFMQKLASMNVPVYLDIAYIGASLQASKLDVSMYPNIEGIFFSLSKSFGVYYHRIGGVLLKHKNPLLYGNCWFKNILSLNYGAYLMNKLPIGFYDEVLRNCQREIVANLNSLADSKFLASDVFLIATTTYNQDLDWHRELQRNFALRHLRVCISPLLESLIYSK